MFAVIDKTTSMKACKGLGEDKGKKRNNCHDFHWFVHIPTTSGCLLINEGRVKI